MSNARMGNDSVPTLQKPIHNRAHPAQEESRPEAAFDTCAGEDLNLHGLSGH